MLLVFIKWNKTMLACVSSCFESVGPGLRHSFSQACCTHKENPSGPRGNPQGFVRFLSVVFLTWRKAGCHLPAGNAASTFPLLSADRRSASLYLKASLCRSEIRGHSSPFPLMEGARPRSLLPWCNNRCFEVRSRADGRRRLQTRPPTEIETEGGGGDLRAFQGSFPGNQQSDSRQRNRHASWKVLGNAEDLLREREQCSFNDYNNHAYHY